MRIAMLILADFAQLGCATQTFKSAAAQKSSNERVPQDYVRHAAMAQSLMSRRIRVFG